MFSPIPTGADNVIGFQINGKIEMKEIEKMIDLTREKLKTHKKLRIYIEFEQFDGIALDALFKDLKFAIQHISLFEKKAVVSGKTWLRKLIPIGEKFFPRIEVKHFSFNERKQALEWVKS